MLAVLHVGAGIHVCVVSERMWTRVVWSGLLCPLCCFYLLNVQYNGIRYPIWRDTSIRANTKFIEYINLIDIKPGCVFNNLLRLTHHRIWYWLHFSEIVRFQQTDKKQKIHSTVSTTKCWSKNRWLTFIDWTVSGQIGHRKLSRL